ncbi:MAG: hypothetical protein GY950_20210 [bacterium]|nr:hypothetical protein [bacterium]
MTKRMITVLTVFCILYIFCITGGLDAQVWRELTGKEHPTFSEMQEAFNKHWGIKKSKNQRMNGWKQFKRWEWFARTRLDANGRFDPSLNWKGWLEKQKRFNTPHYKSQAALSQWSQLGPTTVPEQYAQWGYPGMGRINCITFHPDNPDIIWVGAPSGGLWKTANGGNTWTGLTDHLPNLGVTAILLHPNNPDIIYIATGDGDAGDTFSIGILKSTDGGITWNTTGLAPAVLARFRISKMIMFPSNPEVILAAGNRGIYKTVDGGASWTRKIMKNFKDMEVNPAVPTTWYAAAYARGIYKSTDSGENWQPLTTGLPTENFRRIAVAVSESSPNTIYALYCNTIHGYRGLYRSLDNGVTWEQRSNSPNLLGWDLNGADFREGGQAWYDLVLDIDPRNPEVVYAGGVNMWKSFDGGKTWQIIAYLYPNYGVSYTHADHHALIFHPNDPDTVFSGNDGGLFKSVNAGQNWSNLSAGLAIHQVYRLGQAPYDANKILIGNQDNGSDQYNSGRWFSTNGGDGMECFFDPTDRNMLYTSTQRGHFYRSTDNGRNWVEISRQLAGNGAWVSPFMHDPQENTLYAATDTVYKSTNQGGNWNPISPKLLDDSDYPLTAMAVAAANPDYIYVSNSERTFRTVNGGGLWTELTGAGCPGTVTWIAVDPKTPTAVWMTTGGYEAGQKVFRSVDAGTSWENMSGILPNIPANCITIDPLGGGVYVGTDLGAFYSPNADSSWVTFDNELPNVIVNELEIHVGAEKIRAATYGRGVWESPLAGGTAIYSPVNVTAERKLNHSFLQSEYLDILTWSPNPKNDAANVSGYLIYMLKDDIVSPIGEVEAGTHQFYARKVENKVNHYYISTIDNENKESSRTYLPVANI